MRAWGILVPVHALLLRRLADNTLLPGTNTEEEVTYYARSQAFVRKAMDKPFGPAVLEGLGIVVGYTTLMHAVCQTLALLMLQRDVALSWESAHSLVLTALDAIPRTATMQHRLGSEADLVAMIERLMKPQYYEPSFCTAVLRKWRSSAVAGRRAARTWLSADRRDSKRRECCCVQCPPTCRRREDRAARVRVAVLRQGGAHRPRVQAVLRLSLRVVLQSGASHARLGCAQKGLPRAGQSATGGDGCRRRGIGRRSMKWKHDARSWPIPCGELLAAPPSHRCRCTCVMHIRRTSGGPRVREDLVQILD